MLRKHHFLHWFSLLLLVCGSNDGFAQASSTEVVHCASKNGRWAHCTMNIDSGVDLVRQISDDPCVRGTHWGIDQRGVWVTGGCQADFVSRSAFALDARRVIRCEAGYGRRKHCPVALRGGSVRLMRQLSEKQCRRDENWGVKHNQIWVARGCAAEFEISDPEGVFATTPYVLRCESDDERRYCAASVTRAVMIHAQLSEEPCLFGENWGWDSSGVWVDRGCCADFRVE